MFIASGADIGSVYLKDGATVAVTDIASAGSLAVQTVDGTISANINNVSTVGSYTTQTIDGTVAISTNPVPISGHELEDFSLRYKQLMDNEDGMQPIYLGLAVPGTSTGSANWMIRKNIYNTDNSFASGLFASGNTNFDKVWNDRSGTNAAYS